MSDIHWSIDSLVIKNGAIFGFGWIFHKEGKIASLYIRVESKDTTCFKMIPIEGGAAREDVGRHYSKMPNARNSGFTVLGGFDELQDIEDIYLVCHLHGGGLERFLIPPASIQNNTLKPTVSTLGYRHYLAHLKQAAQLVKSREYGDLYVKAKSFLDKRAKSKLKKGSDVLSLLRATERKNICLILDHDLGGGANQYRHRFVETAIQSGQTVLVVTFHITTLTYNLILINKRLKLRFAIPDLGFVLEAVKYLSVNEIIYNTAVSFVKPNEIPLFLKHLKDRTSGRLIVLIHDFYTICPSHFLLDDKTEFCNIPELSKCSKCLPNNSNGFVSLFDNYSVESWRMLWGDLLTEADEIVCFSKNSVRLLIAAYPLLEAAKIAIRPHKTDFLLSKAPQVVDIGVLRIGVVGNISNHKGALPVQSLAKEIKNRGLELKIVIIGSISIDCDPTVVSQTGTYSHDKLPRLVEEAKVNIMLFPSVCPETFSYVVQELVDMELPVACFNLGAPAERLATYTKGLILSSSEPSTILDELIAFHKKTYLK